MNNLEKAVFIVLLAAISCTLISCSENLLGSDPINTPESNFETMSQDFRNVYPFFEKKGINWDSLYSFYRKKINSQTTDNQLYNVMSLMLANLRDGHVRLNTPLGVYHYENYESYQHNFPGLELIQKNYLKDSKVNLKFVYGHLTDEIGYIYIPVFEAEDNPGSFDFIDQIMEEFKDLKAVVIDIRDNYGGQIDNAKTVASRFADQKHLYVYSRWKVSPAKDDFSEYTPENIEPAGKIQFTKPVTVLSNRLCYSSAEHFLFAMKTFPDVTVIGDTTGGVMGVPVYRELPNGWKYMLPRSIQYDKNKVCYEGKGIPPDIPVMISSRDLQSGKDTILDKAISYLKSKIN